MAARGWWMPRCGSITRSSPPRRVHRSARPGQRGRGRRVPVGTLRARQPGMILCGIARTHLDCSAALQRNRVRLEAAVSRITLWWRATRPFAFSASVISALLGGLLAVGQAGVPLHWGHYLLAILGAAAAHAAANLLNDYFDFRKGVDRPGTLGSSGVLTEGRMAPRAVLQEALLLGALGLLLALYFLAVTGPLLLPLFAAGLVLGIGYTAAPMQLKYRALGDLAVFAAFGIGITLGSYAVQTGRLSWVPVAYAVPISFLVAAILHGNNLRDMRSDRAAGISTLAMRLGPVRGWRLYLALLGLAYMSALILVSAGVIVATGLLVLLSLPLALQIARRFGPRIARISAAGTGGSLALIDVETARLHMVFGLLLTLAVLLTVVF
ncbi:MAG: hypothetical protein GF330_03895 [Candidatus Eisenbacteria bacterium]|nr:hypothetical protein [Candidatus Eisenbacteria bacterium]